MNQLYDHIGMGYNTTRKADPYLTERLYTLLRPKPGAQYLDIGSGTGNYTFALAQKGLSILGVEPSDKMRQIAIHRYPDLVWLSGSAENIPADNNTFDGIIATLTIHHWIDLEKAFRELSRVLAPSGRVVIFTSTPDQMKGYWLQHYFPEMLRASEHQMPALHDITGAIAGSNFVLRQTEHYHIADDLQDCFLYVGKNKPALYFDENIRRGISSFSALSTPEETERGLKLLKHDLDNNTFDDIKQKYAHDLGDYLFVVLEKEG